MNQKIEVLVDIYPPIFSETTQYQYANIRAVNPDEQAIVDNYIQQMQKESELLLDDMIIYVYRYPYRQLAYLNQHRQLIYHHMPSLLWFLSPYRQMPLHLVVFYWH